MKKLLRGPIVYMAIILAIVLLTSSFGGFGQTDKKDLGYTEFLKKVENKEFSRITVTGNTAVALTKNTTVAASDFPAKYDFSTYVPSVYQFDNDLKSILKADNVTDFGVDVVYQPVPETSLFVQLLPYLIPLVLLVVFWYYMMRQSQGGGKTINFARSKAKMSMGENTKKTFEDVAGADEEKEELLEIVDFLRNPKRFTHFGARIPKGVLLVGPPGGGKTLLAKAVAGEAKVPFFSISGSDFVEMFVGVGAARVRDLFESAKKNAPCIIFIDEIDAVGRQRGAGLGGGHDEREQTLNQLLVEMDGFMVNEGIIVMAATNRVDILDPALLRAGRFDRQIFVNYPDIKGREEILRVHSKGKPLGPDVDLKVLAKMTPGFIGADLENIMNEAAILTARRGKMQIGMKEIEEAITKVMIGPEKKSRIMSKKDKEITAFHEVGHAICAKMLPNCDTVHEVSIIPRGLAAGYTMTLPDEDENHQFKSKILDEITMMLGGRAAEKLVLGDITTGASNDIERATKMARSMVVKYGMSDKIGPIFHGGDQEIFLGKELGHSRDYSEEVASEIDAEIHDIIKVCYEKAQQILHEKLDMLHHIAEILMDREKITGEEFETLFNGGELKEKQEEPEPVIKPGADFEAPEDNAPQSGTIDSNGFWNGSGYSREDRNDE